MAPPFVRPRSVPEILDASFQLMRAYFPQMVLANAIILFPSTVLWLLLPPEREGVAMAVESFLLLPALAATSLIVAEAYAGRAPDVRAALAGVRERFWRVVLAGTLQLCAILVGVVACIVPGVVIGTVLFAVPVVVILEGAGTLDAFGRSRELAEHHFWRVLAVWMLASFIYGLPGLGVDTLLGHAAGAQETVSRVLRAIAYVFVAPFPAVATTVLYFDLRIRKEGYGLDDLAEPVGAEAATPGLAGA